MLSWSGRQNFAPVGAGQGGGLVTAAVEKREVNLGVEYAHGCSCGSRTPAHETFGRRSVVQA